MKPGHWKGPVAFNKIYYLNPDSVGCRYNANAVQYHNSDIGYMVAVTEVEYKPEFESPRDTTYLALTGELCGVFVRVLEKIDRNALSLFVLLLCSLVCAQIIEYIMSRWSYSFVCILYHLIITIMQTYLKVLNF